MAYYETDHVSATLFEYCDLDHSDLLSIDEFASCYCTGFQETHEEEVNADLCLQSARTEFALIDSAAIENIGKLSKHEFGVLWNAVECNSASVDDLYHSFDLDHDSLLNYDEFATLFCSIECDGGITMDQLNFVIDQIDEQN